MTKYLLKQLQILKQSNFYIKDINPYLIYKFSNSKISSHSIYTFLGFQHENTFVNLNSNKTAPILAHPDYLDPILLEAYNTAKNYNDVHYNYHKSNIFSLGLCLLHAASLRDLRGIRSSLSTLELPERIS